jgi:cytochrome c oxidase subunit 1
MPRRYFDYSELAEIDSSFTHLNLVSSIGSFMLGAGMLLILGYLIHSLFRGRPAPPNPWGGNSMEWHCSSPPPHDNFASPPPVGDPYDFTGIEFVSEEEGYKPKTS